MQTSEGDKRRQKEDGENDFDLSQYESLASQLSRDLFIEVEGEPKESDKSTNKPLWCLDDTKNLIVEISAGVVVAYLTIKFIT